MKDFGRGSAPWQLCKFKASLSELFIEGGKASFNQGLLFQFLLKHKKQENLPLDHSETYDKRYLGKNGGPNSAGAAATLGLCLGGRGAKLVSHCRWPVVALGRCPHGWALLATLTCPQQTPDLPPVEASHPTTSILALGLSGL